MKKYLLLLSCCMFLINCGDSQNKQDTLSKEVTLEQLKADSLVIAYRKNMHENRKWSINNKFNLEVVQNRIIAASMAPDLCANILEDKEFALKHKNEYQYLTFECEGERLLSEVKNKYKGFIESLTEEERIDLLLSGTAVSFEEALEIRKIKKQ